MTNEMLRQLIQISLNVAKKNINIREEDYEVYDALQEEMNEADEELLTRINARLMLHREINGRPR